jgi:hypothetical protein
VPLECELQELQQLPDLKIINKLVYVIEQFSTSTSKTSEPKARRVFAYLAAPVVVIPTIAAFLGVLASTRA